MTILYSALGILGIIWIFLGLYYFIKINKEASAIKKSILEDKALEVLYGKIEGWEFMLSGVQTAAENAALVKLANERDARPFRFYTVTFFKTILVSPFLLISDVSYLFAENHPNT